MHKVKSSQVKSSQVKSTCFFFYGKTETKLVETFCQKNYGTHTCQYCINFADIDLVCSDCIYNPGNGKNLIESRQFLTIVIGKKVINSDFVAILIKILHMVKNMMMNLSNLLS